MSTRSGRTRISVIEASSAKTRKGVSPTRSPARTRKSSPPPQKTPPPARTSGRKSPSRKSPSRKPVSQFPARKSPSRAVKEAKEPAREVPKSPSKRQPLQSDRDVAVKLEDFAAKLPAFRSTRSKRFDYTIKDLTSSITNSEYSVSRINGVESSDIYELRNRRSVEEVAPRRSTRLRDYGDIIPDIRRSLSKSISESNSLSKSISKSLDTYSDEENSEGDFQMEKSKSVTRKLATPLRSSINSLTQIASKWEFGGRIGSASLIILIPLTVFYILASCSKSCSLLSIANISAYKNVHLLLSINALSYVLAQYCIQGLFALLPVFGPKSDRMDDTGTKYCFNAFFSSIITTNLIFTLDFFQVINKDAILNDYLRLAVISYIFAGILSVVLYLKSRNIDNYDLNQSGNTGYALYDFFIGREIHPFIKNLDLKIWISRISNITALILLTLIFTKGLQIKFNENTDITLDTLKSVIKTLEIKPTLLVYTLMQIVYILNFIMKEYKITTTFYWQSEGLGYMQLVSSALYPFYFTTVSKYVADSQLELATNTLIIVSIVYAAGFIIMLVSNNIKYEFRRNPMHLSLANVDSMPTFHGKKLLVSGLWGLLRHPNYAGDILINCALAVPGIVSRHYVAAAPAVLTILILVHRAWRDHDRCKRRYGAAWQRYCKRVPSILLPKIL